MRYFSRLKNEENGCLVFLRRILKDWDKDYGMIFKVMGYGVKNEVR
jgi:hypothetical protein